MTSDFWGWCVRMDRLHAVKQLLHAGGQGIVCGLGAGKTGVTPHCRYLQAVQDGNVTHRVHPGHVGIPSLTPETNGVFGLAQQLEHGRTVRVTVVHQGMQERRAK